MTIKELTFESGTNGSNITTTSEPLLSAVALDAGASLTYSTDHAAHGVLSAKVFPNGTHKADFSMPFAAGDNVATTPAWSRFYIYLTANPSASIRSGFGDATTYDGYIEIQTDGTLHVSDNSGIVITTTKSLTLNAWNRVEQFVDMANGKVGLRIFTGANVDGTVPDESHDSITAVLSGSGPFHYTFGASVAHASNGAFYVDCCAISSTDWIGPHTDSVVTTVKHRGLLLGVGQ